VKPSEHSRRARNFEPPQPEHQVSERDEWFLSFACALAQIWRLHHDGQMIRHILTSCGISLKHLENAGIDDLDLAALQAAIYPRQS